MTTGFYFGLLSEEFFQLRAEVFPRSKDLFPNWDGLSVVDSTADFCQGNRLSIQPRNEQKLSTI